MILFQALFRDVFYQIKILESFLLFYILTILLF